MNTEVKISGLERHLSARGVARDGLPTLFAGLGLSFFAFAVINGIRLAPPIEGVVVSFNLVLTAVFAGAWWLVRRVPPRLAWAHGLVSASVVLALSNVLTTFWLVREGVQATAVACLLVCAGFFLLSRTWLLVVIGVGFGAWLVLLWRSGIQTDERWQLGSTVFLGVLLASVVQTARLRAHGKLQATHGELEASRERYLRLFEGSKDMVSISTPEGRLVEINPAGRELLGLGAEERLEEIDLGRDVYRDREERQRLLERVLSQGYVRDHPSTIETPRGQIEIEGTTTVIHDAHGNVELLLAIIRDVTRRKREERELARHREELESLVAERTRRLEQAVTRLETEIDERRRVEQERRRIETRMLHAQKLESLGVLAGGIAHDFNNLLVGILGNAELAALEVPESSPARQRLGDIVGAAQRAGELAHQMLAYAGRGQFVFEPCNLGHLVEEMARLTQASIPKKVELELSLEGGLPAIQADSTQVRQVVMNLITNAADAFEGRAGTIAVSLKALDGIEVEMPEIVFHDDLLGARFIVLEVTDDGCGMPEGTKKRLFDPFFSTKQSGRGLGMASVIGIVRAHRGWIRVDSSVGEGTRFAIGLPVSAAGSAPGDAARSADRDEERWSADGTVLVVDDEDVVRGVVVEWLGSMGFDVLVAENGLRAIELFRNRGRDIDLVLLDYDMPVLDGAEVYDRLRGLDPHLRVILSSGGALPNVLVVASEESAGRVTLLRKPYARAELERSIRSVLPTS